MVCRNVGFSLSGGEEAGNITKIRAVYGQFQLLGQIKKKLYSVERGKGDLLLSSDIYIYKKNQIIFITTE